MEAILNKNIYIRRCLNCCMKRKYVTATQSSKTYSYSSKESGSARVSVLNIQMLSSCLHKQIFQHPHKEFDDGVISKVRKHLQKHDLWGKTSLVTDNVEFILPELHEDNIADHFRYIAEQQNKDYFNSAHHMANSLTKIPSKPKKWQFVPGWTKYNEDGTFESVPVPNEKVLIFDVEVCLSAGKVPVMATAVSKKSWFVLNTLSPFFISIKAISILRLGCWLKNNMSIVLYQ